jgi:hypothetical protein
MRRPETRRPVPALAACALVALLAAPATAPAQIRPPGPELFATQPKTPMEYWEAADYLVRTGQARLALPYLQGFLRSKPDDATLVAIRDKYGFGSVLRLADDPATRALAEPLLKQIAAAALRQATDPARIDAAIGLLTRSPEEQAYGLGRLRQAGSHAVPPLIRRLQQNLPAEERALLAANLGRLNDSAVPALAAALDAPDPVLAADVAGALGRIGDARAVPHLLFKAADPEASPGLREAAAQAIGRLTGRPLDRQAEAASIALAAQAWRYHRHQVAFPEGPVEFWTWQGDAPAPSTVTVAQAETALGIRRAREALTLDPANASAQDALVSLALEDAANRFPPGTVATQDPTGAFAAAVAAGPGVLSRVVRAAIADGHAPLAAVAVLALARVTDRDGLAVEGRVNPLVEALSAPDRRVQFAAASALVDLDPYEPFAGSSRVVPALARFVSARAEPRAVIIDGNPNRAGGLASALRGNGYVPEVAATGPEGFELAARSAGVEFVLIQPMALQGPWRWLDTVVNLRADARTAGVPIFLVVPTQPGTPIAEARSRYAIDTGNVANVVEAHRAVDRAADAVARYPLTATIVETDDPKAMQAMIARELARMGARPLTEQERRAYSQAAAALLARIAANPGSPFAAQLPRFEPELTAAAGDPALGLAASAALGGVPGAESQRTLADLLFDPSKPRTLRLSAGVQLTRSVQRFGPLLTAEQEARLLDALNAEPDPAIRSALSAVHGALRPAPEAIGTRLRDFRPPGPEPAPAPDAGAGATPAANPDAGAGAVPAPDDIPPPPDPGAGDIPPPPDF